MTLFYFVLANNTHMLFDFYFEAWLYILKQTGTFLTKPIRSNGKWKVTLPGDNIT
jgi:hypothetical protein